MNFQFIMIIFGIFVALDVILIVIVMLIRSRKKFGTGDKAYFRKEWGKIQELKDLRHAVVDSDKLLHIILVKKGYQGQLGEQLKKAEKLFSTPNDVWYAHKLRNRIAHELNLKITDFESMRAVQCFERAFKDLGAL